MTNLIIWQRTGTTRCCLAVIAMIAASLTAPVQANPDFTPVTAAELNLMRGFPPPPDKLVTRANFMEYPNSRWAFQHIRELQPTRDIYRGDGPVYPITTSPTDLDSLSFTVRDGRKVSLAKWLEESVTDSFLVLHKGKYNQQQLIPAAVAEKILQAGDRAPFNRLYQDPWYEHTGYAYHDQWWTFATPHKPVSAIGVFGQFIYIDPVAEMVIVKQSSHPQAESEANEVDGPLIWHAIAEHLMKKP